MFDGTVLKRPTFSSYIVDELSGIEMKAKESYDRF